MFSKTICGEHSRQEKNIPMIAIKASALWEPFYKNISVEDVAHIDGSLHVATCRSEKPFGCNNFKQTDRAKVRVSTFVACPSGCIHGKATLLRYSNWKRCSASIDATEREPGPSQHGRARSEEGFGPKILTQRRKRKTSALQERQEQDTTQVPKCTELFLSPTLSREQKIKNQIRHPFRLEAFLGIAVRAVHGWLEFGTAYYTNARNDRQMDRFGPSACKEFVATNALQHSVMERSQRETSRPSGHYFNLKPTKRNNNRGQ